MGTYELPKREIKFRCWRGEFDAMEYEPYNQWAETDINYELSTPGKRIYMQYTGLKDKKGKDIYEQDLVKVGYTDGFFLIQPVIFRGGMFCVYDSWGGQAPIGGLSDIEVVGNIFEDIKLLDNQKLSHY